ncbi:hypothetical protein D3C72_1989480 [compost metagenome]
MRKRPVEIPDLPIDDRTGSTACHLLVGRHDFQMGRADLQIFEIEGVQPAPLGARKGALIPGEPGFHISDMHQNGRHKIGHGHPHHGANRAVRPHRQRPALYSQDVPSPMHFARHRAACPGKTWAC